MKIGAEEHVPCLLVGKIHAVRSHEYNYEHQQIVKSLDPAAQCRYTMRIQDVEPIAECCTCQQCVTKWQYI